jgi:hypothetical protein
MQSPVRYYITQGDDEAVVHCVHCVRTQPVQSETEKKIEKAVTSAPAEQRPEQVERAGVSRLVRAATRRAWSHR